MSSVQGGRSAAMKSGNSWKVTVRGVSLESVVLLRSIPMEQN